MKSSKQFVIDRILDQAKLDGVPLTDIETRMLGFTEATASATDLEAAKVFERDFDDEEYETKIARLIRRAYERDKKDDNLESWNRALARIAGGDLYLHVMLERAGIEQNTLSALFSDWRFLVYGLLPPALCVAGAIVIALSPFGARLIRSDTVRFLVALVLLAAPFALARISRRRSIGKV